MAKDNDTVDPPASPPPAPLTEREKAIAGGIDPDSVVSSPTPVSPAPASPPPSDGDSTGTDAPGGASAAPTEPTDDSALHFGPTDAVDPPSSASPVTPAESWITDDVKSLAHSYGLTDVELEKFSGAEELGRVGLLFDRNLVAGVQQAAQAPPPVIAAPAQIAPPPPPFAPSPPPSPSPAVTPPPALDPQKYIDAGYDPETVAIVVANKHLHDEVQQLKGAMQQFQQSQVEAARQQWRDEFHDIVDQMDVDLFGRSIGENGEYVQLPAAIGANRQKLGETADMLRAGIIAQARALNRQAAVPPPAVLLRRASQLAFAEDFQRKDREAYQARVAAQSRRRRPSGQPSGAAVKQDAVADASREDADPVANHPAVVALWNEMTQDNGSAP